MYIYCDVLGPLISDKRRIENNIVLRKISTCVFTICVVVLIKLALTVL